MSRSFEASIKCALTGAFLALDRRKKESLSGASSLGGLTVEETAEALKISPEAVMRDWKLAKVWREVKRGPQDGR
jgi:hypothetical protein